MLKLGFAWRFPSGEFEAIGSQWNKIKKTKQISEVKFWDTVSDAKLNRPRVKFALEIVEFSVEYKTIESE